MSLSVGRKPGFAPRKSRYRVAFETVMTTADGASATLLVRDLSDDGFMAATSAALKPGTRISVELPDIGEVEAEIRWADDGCIGAHFAQPLPAFPRPEKLDRRSGRRSEYPQLKELREDFAAERAANAKAGGKADAKGKGGAKLRSVPAAPAAAQAPAPAAEPAVRLNLPVSIDAEPGRRTVTLFNLTALGAMVEGRGLPQVGEDVRLRTHSISVPGVVVWAGQGRCGITFDRAIAEEAVQSHFGRRGGKPSA